MESNDERANGAIGNAETLESGNADRGAVARELERGATIGRYIILSLLGQGAMGSVYAAYDPELDRRVAIKLLHAARRSEGARIRLVREARALGKLSSPNVVQVYDAGEHAGDVFLAMELVEGESLEAWCNASPRPTWRAILDAYVDAARGLRAAHAAGVIHRDVKPANILRGEDGRVRVADFGLAGGRDGTGETSSSPVRAVATSAESLALGETVPIASASGGASSTSPLTQAGSLMGTPVYMAPEQLRGAAGTAASDQYSLCASLYEGLFGMAPHEQPGALRAETIEQLLVAKVEPLPPSPPPGSDTPLWVYRAVARGLAPNPAHRHPSVDALLDTLTDDPELRARGRRRTALLAVAAVALVAVAGIGWARSGSFDDPCKHADRELSGVWDDGVRTRLNDALAGTGRSYARSTATLVASKLDAYAASFVSMRGEVCEASRSGAARREVTALRDACLDRRRGRLAALTGVLTEKSDTRALDKGVSAAEDLPPIADCADVTALAAPFPPPDEPAARARVRELEARVDRVQALEQAGKYAEGLTLAEPLVAEAEQVGFPPLLGDARFWLGRLVERGAEYARAKDLLRASAAASAEGRDASGAQRAWARVLFILGERERHIAEAAAVASFGPTLAAGTVDASSRAAWLNAEGLFLYRAGKNAEALATHQRALAANEQAFGHDHLSVANSLNNIGLVYGTMGDHVRAFDALERSVAIFEKVLGTEHPDVANALNNLGIAYFDSGDLAGAKANYARAIEIYEQTLGADHVEGAAPILNMGNVLFVTGDYAGAKSAYEREVRLQEKAHPSDHPELANAVGNLAEADYNLGEYAASEALGLRAMASRATFFGPDSVEVASAATTVGRARVRLGRLREAEEILGRALAVKDKAFVPGSSDMSDVLLAMGGLRLAQKRPTEAVHFLERALAIADSYGKPEILLTLAEALVAVGKNRDRARALATDARDAYGKLGHASGVATATRFLADHP